MKASGSCGHSTLRWRIRKGRMLFRPSTWTLWGLCGVVERIVRPEERPGVAAQRHPGNRVRSQAESEPGFQSQVPGGQDQCRRELGARRAVAEPDQFAAPFPPGSNPRSEGAGKKNALPPSPSAERSASALVSKIGLSATEPMRRRDQATESRSNQPAWGPAICMLRHLSGVFNPATFC